MIETDGPTPSFERLARELGAQLYGYLRRMIGNSADADDLLQEALLRIARGLPTLERSAAVKPWAFRIATNVAIDHIRKHKRATLVEFAEEDGGDAPDEMERLVLDEMNSCVRSVIQQLPPDYRAALVLHSIEGRSVSEIAEILSISKGATKVRLHRAKGRLKAALDRECTFYATPEGTIRCERRKPDADC